MIYRPRNIYRGAKHRYSESRLGPRLWPIISSPKRNGRAGGRIILERFARLSEPKSSNNRHTMLHQFSYGYNLVFT